MTESNQSLVHSLKWPLAFVSTWWLIHVLQWMMGWELGYLGIYPLKSYGLKGILIAPLIHGDFSHLIHNSIPFLVLSTIIIYFYQSVAFRSFLMIYFLTGLAVWLGARPVFHIGASGVVYGLVTFLMGNGLFRRNNKSIVLALVVFLFYSGMLVGVLPNQQGISWESHLYGALVGFFVAYFYKGEIEEDERDEYIQEKTMDEQLRPFFLAPDTFDLTRAERAQRQREAEERQRNSDWTSSNTLDDGI
ncbi:MAG: rhomboid family intramembrane serine protease [Bacteroidota bacterium]